MHKCCRPYITHDVPLLKIGDCIIWSNVYTQTGNKSLDVEVHINCNNKELHPVDHAKAQKETIIRGSLCLFLDDLHPPSHRIVKERQAYYHLINTLPCKFYV